MIQQWQQTLSTDPKQMAHIFPFARKALTDQQIAEQLMPESWYVPYRLATTLKDKNTAELKQRLFLKAATSAKETLADDPIEVNRALGAIASGRKQYDDAAAFYSKAVAAAPKDAELHYRHAPSLYRAGRAREAAQVARVTKLISPSTKHIEGLYDRAQALHRKQTSSGKETRNAGDR